MTEDALEVVRLRNDFYRHNYRQLVVALVLSVVSIFLLVGALVYCVTHPPEPRYFATSSDGRILPLVPLAEPNLSDAALLQWTQKAAVSAFTYNYGNYREMLQNLRVNFTESGWRSFSEALNSSNNLTAVIEKKLIVSAVPTGVPVIVSQGLISGRYAWKVQIPLLVRYESGSDTIQQAVTVTLLVRRISTLQSVKGIGITQFVVAGSGNVSG